MSTSDPTLNAPDSGADENALFRLAREAVDTALAGDIKRGLALALEASSRARDAQDRRAELAALNAAARCHSLRHDSINSLAAGIDAAALAQALGDGVALGHALCAIVNTSFTVRLLEECEPFVVRALDEGLRHDNADLESRARQTYGVLLGDLKRFDEAAVELARAVTAAQRDGRPALLLRVEVNVVNLARKRARIHAARGETEPLRAVAVSALDQAAVLLERAYAQNVLASAMNLISLKGEIHALLGDIDRGIAETTQAMELAQLTRLVSNLPPLSLRLGRLLRQSGQIAESVEVLQRGLSAAETLRPTFRIAELCDAMAVAEDARDAAAAEGWRQRAHQEHEQFESGRQMAAGFLKRLSADLAGPSTAAD